MTKVASRAKGGSQERTYGGLDIEVRMAERRQRLIVAGIHLFSTTGYHATTVRALIAESGLATRYFYESFNSLEELLVACYEHLMAELRKDLDELASQPHSGIEELVSRGMRRFFEAMREPSFVRITQVEILGISKRVDDMYFNAMHQMGSVLMSYTLQSVADGESKALSPVQVDIIGTSLTGAIATAATVWAREGYRQSTDELISTVIQIVLGTIDRLKA